MFLDQDALASILWIHIINVEIPVWGRHQQARELLNPGQRNTLKLWVKLCIHTPLKIHPSLISLSQSDLRSEGADVLQAKHVESYCGESSVLMHHVGHLGGQVGAGCCEHFAHICWPCRRLLLLTGRKQDGTFLKVQRWSCLTLRSSVSVKHRNTNGLLYVIHTAEGAGHSMQTALRFRKGQ